MNQKIIHLATLTLIGFPLLGWVILWATGGPDMISLFQTETPLFQQLIIGILTGLVTGGIAWAIIQSDYMQGVREKYSVVIRNFKLSPAQILYISLCAGIGEEIFFRGIIQPYLGIWITAILFVAIHGYLDPRNFKLFLYGAYMTLAIALIGFFSRQYGLYSAIAAHAVIDIILLYQMARMEIPETIKPENSLTGNNGQ